jgi:hypothetical protein
VGVCLSGGYLRATIRPTEQGEQREARIQHYLQFWYRARALVVIHELCHLIHPNHSKAFWQLVGRHDAAFAAHRQWLKQRGEGLL